MPRPSAFLCLLTFAVLGPRSEAQFYGNAVPAELLAMQAGNVWFGAVRNAAGDFLADATVLLDSGVIEYVAVTERDGRFRLVLPEATALEDVSPSCARDGFTRAEVRLRPPPRRALSPVEVTCVLH